MSSGSAEDVVGKGDKEEYERWLESRPPHIRELGRKYPCGGKVLWGEKSFWIIGYNENGMIIISPVDPAKDFEGAKKQKLYVHAEHFKPLH